jgi:CHAT domain-containing protein
LAIGSPPRVDISDLGLKDEAGKYIQYADKLLNAKLEVQQVSTIFTDKKVFIDDAASETAAINNASNSDIVLFSAHGYLNRSEPLKSAILLNKDSSNDGRLTVSDIENMSIKANLVALSACETGLVTGYEGISQDIYNIKFPHGDDLVGLQRGFMKAGTSSVLSTLWSVDDESTSAFMIEFFKLYKSGKDKPTSLQEAAQKLMNSDKEWQYPYFWAPFVFSGDWR